MARYNSISNEWDNQVKGWLKHYEIQFTQQLSDCLKDYHDRMKNPDEFFFPQAYNEVLVPGTGDKIEY